MAARPSYVVKDANIRLTIPEGWSHTTIAISRQKYQHLVTLHNSLYSKSKTLLRSSWNKTGEAMKDFRSEATSAAMGAHAQEAIIDFNFYYSTTKIPKNNIPSLQDDQHRSHALQVIDFKKPANAPKFIPDYMTLFIFVNDTHTNQQAGASFDDMVVTVNLVYSPEVDLDDEPDNPNPDPPPPPPNTKPGYNPALDKKRPSTIENYLKYYDTVFLIDDSGSMAEGNPTKWHECVQAVIGIANTAIDNDQDGIDIYFLNSDNVFKVKDEVQGVTDKSKVAMALGKVGPSGGTPTGEKVGERLQAHLRKIDAVAGQRHTYRDIKPLDLIVITDGCPGDDPRTKDELEKAAKHIIDNNYHPNHMGIQFVQIGNDAGADLALKALTQANANNMVDTVPYTRTLTPEVLQRILLGGLHPNVRAQNNP